MPKERVMLRGMSAFDIIFKLLFFSIGYGEIFSIYCLAIADGEAGWVL